MTNTKAMTAIKEQDMFKHISKCNDERACGACYSGQGKCERQQEAFEHMFTNFNTLGSTNHKDWMRWAFDKGTEWQAALSQPSEGMT